ncbi:MAG TPA: DNA polymerase III subunit delta [Acidimicrobiales bacterium]
MAEALLSKEGAALPCYLVDGEDPSLVAQELSSLLAALVDLSVITTDAIEEYGDAGQVEELDVGAIVNACCTPPFLTATRVVVVRDATGFDAASQKEIAAYLSNALPTTVLVLANPGRVGAALAKAANAHGIVIHAQPGNARARTQWISEHLHDATLRLDNAATALLADNLGEDLARLDGLTKMLVAAYGPNATVHESDLEPFLGAAGAVAPWDLTDALDAGDSARAIEALHRMLEAGDRHPFQIIAILHRHYGAMLRLDGAEIADEAGASAATGLAPYPAKKVLLQSRRLGHDRVTKAIQLLGAADLDLRGLLGWPDELIMEVLVARLAQLVRLSSGGGEQGRRSQNRNARARSQES